MTVKSRFLPGLLLAVAACAICQPGQAGTVTQTYSFYLSGFVNTLGTDAAPYTSMTGTFTLTFDPTVAVTNKSTDIVVDSLSVPVTDLPIGFTTGQVGTSDFLGIGGLSPDGTTIVTATDDVEFYANVTNLNAPSLITCAQVSPTACGLGNGDDILGGYSVN